MCATLVQEAALQCLGLVARTYAAFLQHSNDAGVDRHGLLHPSRPVHYWNPANRHNQKWIDALTTDTRTMLCHARGIAVQGDPFPPIQMNALNAAVGTQPVMMAYAMVAEGTDGELMFPYTGARGGQSQAYAGYQYWHNNQPPHALQHIQRRLFYNRDGAAARKVTEEGCVTQAFDPGFFRVCHFSLSFNVRPRP